MNTVLKKIEKVIQKNPIAEILNEQGVLSSPVKNREVIHSLLDRFIHEQDGRPPSSQAPTNSNYENPSTVSSPAKASLQNGSEDMTDAIEEFIAELASCYQLYGCPTHILEINMVRVAKGLGIDMDFACLPTHTLMSVIRNRPDGSKKKSTLFFKTTSGLNMYKLQLVDELVRRISSYATKEPPKLSGNASISLASPLIGLSLDRSDLNVDRPRTESPDITNSSGSKKSNQDLLPTKRDTVEIKIEPETHDEQLKQAILEIASFGPGFFTKNSNEGSAGNTPVEIVQASAPVSEPVTRQNSAQPSSSNKAEPMPPGGQSLLGSSAAGTPSVSKKTIRKNRRHLLLDKRYEKTFRKIAVEDGVRRLNQIKKAKSLYPIWFQWILTGFASAGCCGIFFGGNWIDTGFSFLLGLLVALLGEGNRNPNFTRIYEFIAAFVVALLTRTISNHVVPLCFSSVAISSIIWLLQGVTITLAMVELLTRKLVSGTVRLFYGIMMSAIMSFGLDMGTAIYARIAGRSQSSIDDDTICGPDHGLGPDYYALFFLMASLSFNVLIEAHWRQLLPMTVISAVATFVNIYTDKPLGSSASCVVSALACGISANIYSRLTGNPAIIGVLSGLLMLVPGSVAVRGFGLLFQNDISGGIGLAITVVVVCLALAVGTFAASLLVLQEDLKLFQRRRTNLPEGESSRIPRSELIF